MTEINRSLEAQLQRMHNGYTISEMDFGSMELSLTDVGIDIRV